MNKLLLIFLLLPFAAMSQNTRDVPGNRNYPDTITVVTRPVSDSSKKVASTAFVKDVLVDYVKVVASGNLDAASTTTSVITYTTPDNGNIGVYDISLTIKITAVTAGVLTTTVSYTDETNSAATATFFSMASSPISGIISMGKTHFPVLGEINAYPNTSITVTTTLTAGTATYNVGSTVVFKRNIAL